MPDSIPTHVQHFSRKTVDEVSARAGGRPCFPKADSQPTTIGTEVSEREVLNELLADSVLAAPGS